MGNQPATGRSCSYEQYQTQHQWKVSPSSATDWGLADTHQPVRFLGRGSTGETWLFREIATKQLVAIKLISRPIPQYLLKNLLREITIQSQLAYGCLNITNANEVILTTTHLAIAMEYAPSGSLTNFIVDRWPRAQNKGLFMSEDEARYLFKQIIHAVKYCHEHCVAHRDLKLDNVLLDGHAPPRVKLCDFGFARTWTADASMNTHIGTPVYMAPELANTNNKQSYNGKNVDVWACGVLLCVMLLGVFPFDHEEERDASKKEAHLEIWVQQVTRKWNDIPLLAKSVKKLTPECQDLLNRIFVVEEHKRITIADIERHAWYCIPLSGRFQQAWEELGEEQKKLDQHVKSTAISRELLKQRNQQVEDMILKAAREEGKLQRPVRISLMQDNVLASLKPVTAAA